jgi:serine/threonine protein phosphatase PrpC
MANIIKAAVRSGMGRIRKNNEDAFFFNGRHSTLDSINEEAAFHEEFPIKGALFAVSDGIGGANSGEIASDACIQNVKNLKIRLESLHFAEAIGPWVRETNTMVIGKTPGGGCTLAMLYVESIGIYIAHVGDSRVYRLHEGELIRMTKDHSKVQILVDAGILTPEQALAHPQRHMVVRYIGMDEEENGICTATLARPMPIMHKDRYLVCTDGITDMVDDKTLENLLKQEPNTDACAEAIYRVALDAGGRDNATLILLDIEITDKDLLPKQPQTYTEDKYESTLEPSLPQYSSVKKMHSSDRLSIVHTCHLPKKSGNKMIIRSEININR